MDLARLLRGGMPTDVTVLAVISLVSGVGCLLAASVPLAAKESRRRSARRGRLPSAVPAWQLGRA
jgi:hypothetical protein